ncbi:uncharacterized protein LOC21386182 isoform X1 [Morus notabilis]|uniref:uncharacterized protein LOC21386182 isoform X1 n=1 Tax=Morus notabilis TaxID=981085 RepID=UPI000CED3307|nr:uncharacterized protein LOC21386182 isoform X1 [Morus notabilis]XP_024027391.1 uncharacterized protein LOC21386182 isoform X1 [Morus notabilis]
METVVGVDNNSDEGKFEECGVEKSSSCLSSPKYIADPVVYKLVRVDGDGRFVPATDDEVMEVEDFLVDDKTEMIDVADIGKTADCTSNEGSDSGKLQLEVSEGLSHSENVEAHAEKLTSEFENIEEVSQKVKEEEGLSISCGSPDNSDACMNVDSKCADQHYESPAVEEKLQFEIPMQETVPSSTPRVNDHCNDLSESIGEFYKPPSGQAESGPSTSAVCNNSKPDFSKLEEEICLDNLSIRELHEFFRATFGRETTVKDKLWLKRRIAMGLTNSCDVATTTFTIKDNKLVNKGNEENCKNTNAAFTEDSRVEAVLVSPKNSPTNHSTQREDHKIALGERFHDNAELDCGSDDLHTEERAAKRVRKPTRRYIEELSEAETRDCSPKVHNSVKNIGCGQTSQKFCLRPIKSVSLNERIMLTRLDSLGGSGIEVPCVSRVRRSRPRKNIKALMKFHPSSLGMAAEVVKVLAVPSSLANSECTDKVSKSRSASETTEPLLTSEAVKDKQSSATGKVQVGKNLGLKHTDSSEDTSDDNTATVRTAKGGMRRKHHRAWTLVEVMKLVEGVSKCGAGRWSEIKRLSFASYSYRTSVDLKDKWRNLLKASLAQTPPDEGMNSRKHASVPIPAPILLRVRELAEMHSQVPPNLGSNMGGVGGRSMHETRSGYL